MNTRPLKFSMLALALMGGALAASTLRLVIDGRAAGSAITVNGQTYVPLSALKAAGVGVSQSAGQLSLSLHGAASPANAATGGANPLAAQSGCLNQTLSNGVWSVKFSNLHFVANDPKEYNESYWALDARVSNLTNQVMDPAFLGGLNADNLTWVGADGNTLESHGSVDLATRQAITYRHFLPGQPFSGPVTINTDPPVTKDKPPVKLVWQIDPSKVTRKLPWSGKDASFRVDLTCTK